MSFLLNVFKTFCCSKMLKKRMSKLWFTRPLRCVFAKKDSDNVFLVFYVKCGVKDTVVWLHTVEITSIMKQ